jgi:integrase
MEDVEKSDKRYDHPKDMVTIALNTGMRLGEVLGMKETKLILKKGL